MGSPKDALIKDYPELAEFIGEEGKTLAAIQKEFPGETDNSLKDKGFWYSGKNKAKLKDSAKTGRYYLTDPHLQ